MYNRQLESIWYSVPVTYYQQGIRTNLLKRLWHRRKIHLAHLLLKDRSFKNCLDVGCASGYMISEIAKAYPNASYYGVDVYKKAIEYAKKTYPSIRFFHADAQALPFDTNSFDLILFYETVEHIEDPRRALEELKRVLKKKGTVIVAMDSGSFLFRLIWFFWEKTSGRVWQGAHLHPFHHAQLEKLIQKVGFRIVGKKFSHLGMEVIFMVQK